MKLAHALAVNRRALCAHIYIYVCVVLCLLVSVAAARLARRTRVPTPRWPRCESPSACQTPARAVGHGRRQRAPPPRAHPHQQASLLERRVAHAHQQRALQRRSQLAAMARQRAPARLQRETRDTHLCQASGVPRAQAAERQRHIGEAFGQISILAQTSAGDDASAEMEQQSLTLVDALTVQL